MAVVSAYGPTNALRRKDLQRELAGVADMFKGSYLFIIFEGGNFNVNLEATCRPNSKEGIPIQRTSGRSFFSASLV